VVGRQTRDPDRSLLDGWILSRAAEMATTAGSCMDVYDARGATRAISEFVDDLSQWWLRRSRRRLSRADDATDQQAAFGTMHLALMAVARTIAPLLPFLAEEFHQVLVASTDEDAPESVHLTAWPAPELAPLRDEALEAAMADLRRAVELGRTLRSQAGIKVRQPLGTLWLAMPADWPTDESADELLGQLAEELNVKTVEIIGDESDLVDRRVKPLLPVIGRKYGPQIPAIMGAARANEVEYHDDGSVTLAGVTLEPGEVEILATPRPGTAVAHDEGIVVVIDTELTPELVAEGDARELTRAVQDLRKQGQLALDARIRLWLDGPPEVGDRLSPYLEGVAADVLADEVLREVVPDGAVVAEVPLTGASMRIALQTVGG
jgi:isoleucyl-tRNA synthetase